MATHFICQATEPIPHKFPTSRNQEKGHGAVSQYEVLNLAAKKHTEFPPPGWDTSQSSEDSLPLCQPPAPVWKVPTNLIGPDPDLCLTPERGVASRKAYNISGFSNPPVPTQSKPIYLISPDPELCITPEKNLINQDPEQKSNLKPDLNSKSKKSHRVRFDVDETNSKNFTERIDQSEKNCYDPGSYECFSVQSGTKKTYKPLSYYDQEESEDNFRFSYDKQSEVFESNIDENIEKPFTSKFFMKDDGKDSGIEIWDKLAHVEEDADEQYVPVLPEVLADSNPQFEISPDLSNVRLKSGKKSKPNEKSEIDSTIPIMPSGAGSKCEKSEIDSTIPKMPSGTGSKRKVKITRESRKGQSNKDYQFPFEGSGESLLEYEHVFARPEYNSTLRIRSEIEQMRESTVDMSKALEKKLNVSDTKVQINEKAAARVNADVQFSGLVSLEVPLQDLCTTAERETEDKWRSVKQSRPKYKVTKGKEAKEKREPDLLEFFTPDLQRETVELSVPSPSTPSETLATASHMTAFDLYRHNRVWDSSSNFRIGK